ncbi:PTS mannose transporter subunit IIAB [Enterococcus gallinarum]|uniref:PTS sugar transporter subunit IIA n=1 Tax=Enterococcus gallinarum TaxID=1353 RepID=UPI00214C368B|nr:PTS mannose transporter subunit IIAB [Enterococcus gallinarum]MCR1927163.1 PTS mannose transporter subunit IIAB [Enterococcus gallinarum]
MIGMQIISHGELSQGIVHSLQMIIGETQQMAFDTLAENEEVDSFRQKILDQSRKLDRGHGVLVFVDMIGATPYNCAYYNSQFFDPNHYQIVAGFNLPLVIEAIMQREQMSLSQLVAHLRQAAIDTIVFQDKYE